MHCIAFVFQIAMEKFELKRVMLCYLAIAISREKNGMYFYIIGVGPKKWNFCLRLVSKLFSVSSLDRLELQMERATFENFDKTVTFVITSPSVKIVSKETEILE